MSLNSWIDCPICRSQNSFSGIGHWAWHQFCRAELNPIAMIQHIESMRLGIGGASLIGYIATVTGMDLDAARKALRDEEKIEPLCVCGHSRTAHADRCYHGDCYCHEYKAC